MDAKAAAARDSSNDEDSLFQKLKPNYGSSGDGRIPPEAPDRPKFDVPPRDDGKVALDADDGTEERSVAGRKTMKIQKGKNTVQADDREDKWEAKAAFNDILKRSPSMYPPVPFF